MYFDNWSDVIEMGGHGAFVWSTYLITVLVLVYLVWSPLARHRRQLQNLRHELEVEQTLTSGDS